jgi:hypothetical protein
LQRRNPSKKPSAISQTNRFVNVVSMNIIRRKILRGVRSSIIPHTDYEKVADTYATTLFLSPLTSPEFVYFKRLK